MVVEPANVPPAAQPECMGRIVVCAVEARTRPDDGPSAGGSLGTLACAKNAGMGNPVKRRRSRFLPNAARKWVGTDAAVETALQQYQLYCDLGLGDEPIIWREKQFQASVVSYIDKKYPAIGNLCFHVPLELLRRESHTAGMFHSLGARAGVADIVMLVPRGAYHGFTLELKVAPKRPTDSQCLFLSAARAQGYAACWTDKYNTALALIDAYLALPARATLRELLTPSMEDVPDEFRRHRQPRRKAHRSGQSGIEPAEHAPAVADGTAGARQHR